MSIGLILYYLSKVVFIIYLNGFLDIILYSLILIVLSHLFIGILNPLVSTS